MASHKVPSVNSNQGLLQILEDNHPDLEHNQADLEGELVASVLNLIPLVLVNHRIQVASGEDSALKHNLNKHQHLVMSVALDRTLKHNSLVYLEVISEEGQVALDNKVDLVSNKTHLDLSVILVRKHLNPN